MIVRTLPIIFLSLLLTGCFKEKPVAVAKIGNAGSLTGPHGINDMWVSDIYGGGANFAYGAVQGCCASASIGIGVPNAIKGEWRQGWRVDFKSKERWRAKWNDDWGSFYEIPHWYRIDDVIDSELAKQKIQTMTNYYKNHKAIPVMQVLVDGPKIMVLYKYSCNSSRPQNDCTVRDNADPNGWVKPTPFSKLGYSTSVVLYEGMGEISDKPFEG
ncbi:hypothetical protein [Vibrio tetraodonis]|uniref:hypothetical protein n=1 Tax=Vibrio tetraodonis TaxID=2231647 RepID=UPI000E0C1771|nr:hypothetical protein [Vibrio tetraodonis]